MNQPEIKKRKLHAKRTLAAILCGCMLLQTAEKSVFAEQNTEINTSETEQQPEWSDQPDEELPFGAYAVSSTEMYRNAGENATLKVYAWSSRDELVYIWYDPSGLEMQE